MFSQVPFDVKVLPKHVDLVPEQLPASSNRAAVDAPLGQAGDCVHEVKFDPVWLPNQEAVVKDHVFCEHSDLVVDTARQISSQLMAVKLVFEYREHVFCEP